MCVHVCVPLNIHWVHVRAHLFARVYERACVRKADCGQGGQIIKDLKRQEEPGLRWVAGRRFFTRRES